ncbi:protein jim lovell-like [Macrosteles quadrilineatus]|uniref:protein jim lovell-like n=1 Tax=Macrosteles quadrilineatus TaxID=74068 RepID=UPI0023E29A48|nr:protein jim lovell-like [Macrosteles quadrilineatus]
MGSPHYNLRWNNHQNHLLTAFDSLLQNETLVDVTLICEESSFKAHKVVLSACSPYFERIFSETPCKHPVIVLKDLRGWEVQAIVDFMYRGEISVGQEQLTSLIKAAESLQVRGLAHTERIPMCGPENKERDREKDRDRDRDRDTSGQSGGSGGTFSPSSRVSMFPAGLNASSPQYNGPLRLPQLPHMPHISFTDRHCNSPLPRRKQARPRRRSGEICGAQDLTKGPNSPDTEAAENLSIKKNNNNLPLNRVAFSPSPSSVNNPMKIESEDSDAADSSQNQPMELTTTPSDSRPEPPTPTSESITSLPPPPHVSLTTPKQETFENSSFPHLTSISALSLTPPHMFSLDAHFGLFPGMESCRNSFFNDFTDHRGENHQMAVKKKMGRPKGQHSAPRGGPPRSWTNAELTEALQHVWNKKMTTSQASRIFGIPYNSLLMYVRGKYGKSLKLEQLKKECFGDVGGPLDILGLGPLSSNNNNPPPKHHLKGPEPDLMLGPPGFNPGSYPSPNFYPDFGASFPVPVGMVHLLPQSEKNRDHSGPVDYVKDEYHRNLPNPMDYGKEEVRSSPANMEFSKEEMNLQNNSVEEDEGEQQGQSQSQQQTQRHHEEQNGQD